MRLRTQTCQKVFSLIGVHFLTAPSSFLWNYGNLFAYMESYFQMYCSPHCVDGDSQWIINLYSACFCPGLCLSGPVCRYLGFRWAGIIAMIICNAGLLGAVWGIQESIIGTAVLLGIVNGIGMGMSLCAAFMYVNGWAGKNKGLFVATVTSAPTILSIIQNQIITAYVNPDNLKPDVQIGPKAYFSQISLLKRVPNIVLILALMTLGLQLLANLILTPPPNSQSDEKNTHENGDVDGFSLVEEVNGHTEEKSACCEYKQDKEQLLVKGKETPQYLSSDGIKLGSQTTRNTYDDASATEPALSHARKTPKDIKATDSSSERKTRSYKPLEAIKTGSFKALWLYVVALMYGLNLKNNYYKQFGLVYIEDDQFLTLVGSLIPVAASTARISFGSMLDRKVLGVKDCMVITLSLNAVLCAFWWFVPQVSSIAYMFLILGLASVHSVTYTLAATGSLILLGPDHFATNLALVYTSAFVISIVTAFTCTPLLQALGWFGLFVSCGMLSAIVLTIVVFIKLGGNNT